MLGLIKKNINHHLLWLSLSSLIVILPLFLFGHPGYYGDDFNMILGLNDNGLFGSIQSWVNSYGISYRPIGISLLYLFYQSFDSNPFLIYLIHQLTYLAIGWVIYLQIFKFTSKKWLAIFVSVFFILFPFNSSVYLQLASFSMVIATLLSLILMPRMVVQGYSNEFKYSLFLSLFWIIMLLSYEQIIGLISVIIFINWVRELNNGVYLASKKTFLSSIPLLLVTIIFLFSYFSTSQNAKISSLSNINTEYQVSQNSLEEIKSDMKVGFISEGTRIKSTVDRLAKVTKYFIKNVSYSVNSLLDSNFKGISLLLLLGFFASLILFIDFSHLNQNNSLVIMSLGILWFVATIAPFFLYPEANIPPYTLMLPSIGLGFAVYGFFSLSKNLINSYISTYLLKTILFAGAFLFPLMQYGYYFGLKEELMYWKDLSYRAENYKNELLVGNRLVINNVLKKNNNHIFWLEDFISSRYFRDTLDKDFPSIIIDKEPNKIIIYIGELKDSDEFENIQIDYITY